MADREPIGRGPAGRGPAGRDPVAGGRRAAGRTGSPPYVKFFAAVWLFYLGYPVLTAVTELDGWRRATALAALLAFAAGYVVLLWLAWDRSEPLPRRVAVYAGLVALVVLTTALVGSTGLVAAVYLVSGGAVLFGGRAGLVVSAAAAAAGLSAMAVPGLRDWGTAFALGLVFVIMRVVAVNIARERELGRAQEEIARLAVSEERLRFSRDLHDILGHSLTAISVKAGLAARLVERDPARAGAEITDVERLAREALADVRETVAGYRSVTLVAELARARAALSAAGIDADLPGAVDDVPGANRELFGWVVREGVTNVVRHSGAHRCVVRVGPGWVSVADDGTGCAGGAPTPGSGLSGLRERVAAAGGELVAGSGPGGGFRVEATVAAPVPA